MLHEVTVRATRFLKFKIESPTVEEANQLAIAESKKHFRLVELVEVNDIEAPVQE